VKRSRRKRPGEVRDPIEAVLGDNEPHTLAGILRGVKKLVPDVSESSVRSYLNNAVKNPSSPIVRVKRGVYRMKNAG
jgi:hypothetical protein